MQPPGERFLAAGAGKLYDYEHAVSAVRDPPWVRRDDGWLQSAGQ